MMQHMTRIAGKPFFPKFAILLFALLVSCQDSTLTDLPATPAERMTMYVQYLASDELEGRAAGSEGNHKAADYLKRYFKGFGVKPVGGSYFQEFKVTTDVQLAEGNSVAVTNNNQTTEWKLEEEYIPLAFSENSTVSGEVVFAGYGITAKDLEYDDYAAVDVENKIVVIFRESPDFEDPHGKFSQYISLNYKIRNARDHKVAGVIFINPPSDEEDELFPLKRMKGDAKVGIPAIHAKRTLIEALLPSGKELAKIEEAIKSATKPQSFAMPDVRMEMTTALHFVEKPTANVLGMVAGADPNLSEEYIIVGAHYDHLGWGGDGSRNSDKEPAIHNGADDNASGTAALLEIAYRIAQNPLPRPVIFIGFSAEEMGALGSGYYCKNPLIPLEKTILMLNLDMVGRMKDNKLQVTGTGTSSHWDSLVDSLAEVYGLTVSKSADGYGPSDHASFYAKDIPVLNLFTGLHDDYHRPTDTWDKLNFEGLVTITDFATDIVKSVAHFNERPDFIKVKTSARSGQNMAFRVSMGIVPDYADHPKGMRISGVREGGPGAEAGIQDGDILIKFGDTEIKNIYDYTYALGLYKHGDKVKIVVLRGENEDQEVTLEVTLKGRKKR